MTQSFQCYESFTTSLRIREAHRLTELMEENKKFSFVRLSDGEIRWILDTLAGIDNSLYKHIDVGNVEQINCTAGFHPDFLQRFLKSYENATYVDYCESTPYVKTHLSKVPIHRPPEAYRNTCPDTSNIFFEWCAFELKSWLKSHRCLFASAESTMLNYFWKEPRFRSTASEVLHFSSSVFFHQIRENGKNYSENLNLIKEDLRKDIVQNKIDTVFLSLGSGAKILCSELAEELNIRLFDFGSLTRALVYSGSAGYQSLRQTHNPYLYRLPFALWMEGVQHAFPDMTQLQLAVRIYSQLTMELHRKIPLRFNTSDGYVDDAIDCSPENMAAFKTGYRIYQNNYRDFFLNDPEIKNYDLLFHRWLWKKGIGWKGKLFQAGVKGKVLLRKLKLVR